jgi:hypothetical protein
MIHISHEQPSRTCWQKGFKGEGKNAGRIINQ